MEPHRRSNLLPWVVFFVILTYVAREGFDGCLSQFDQWVSGDPLALRYCAMFAAFFLGYGFYRFRKWSQELYGILEICVGACTAFSTMGKYETVLRSVGKVSLGRDPERVLGWLGLLSAIYLIVRGFTNMEEGQKKTMEEDAAKAAALKAAAKVLKSTHEGTS